MGNYSSKDGEDANNHDSIPSKNRPQIIQAQAGIGGQSLIVETQPNNVVDHFSAQETEGFYFYFL